MWGRVVLLRVGHQPGRPRHSAGIAIRRRHHRAVAAGRRPDRLVRHGPERHHRLVQPQRLSGPLLERGRAAAADQRLGPGHRGPDLVGLRLRRHHQHAGQQRRAAVVPGSGRALRRRHLLDRELGRRHLPHNSQIHADDLFERGHPRVAHGFAASVASRWNFRVREPASGGYARRPVSTTLSTNCTSSSPPAVNTSPASGSSSKTS